MHLPAFPKRSYLRHSVQMAGIGDFLKKMSEISGVGAAKLDKYGQRFLSILKAEFPTPPASVETANEKKKAAVS